MKRQNRWSSVSPNDTDRAFRNMDWQGQLAQLDKRWVSHTPENEAAWQAQNTLCWQCVYAACMQYRGAYTYDERAEAAILVMQELQRYDPQKYHLQEGGTSSSALVSYTLGLLRLKLRTAYTQGIDIEYDAPAPSESPGASGPKGKIAVSLDQAVGEDEDSETRMVLLQDPLTDARNNPFAKDAAAAVLFSFLAQVIHFDTYQTGQRNNDTRRTHYRLCFTEQAVCFAMQGGFRRILTLGQRYFHAADIERALCQGYLAFFCQEVPPDLLLSPEKLVLKRRCDCFHADPTESEKEDRLQFKDSGFLEAKVPLRYLAEAENTHTGNGEISRYRDDYIQDTKELVNRIGYNHTILHEIG